MVFTQHAMILPFAFLLAIHLSDGAGFFGWWGSSEDSTQGPSRVRDGVPLISVPFEVQTADDKFLQEAAKYTSMKLSELDTCQHRVVMKIRGSCSSISEEELAKMSVNLLNCQSKVEGRQVFPCTETMELRACTSAMDSDTWNAYHLMNNRARAVCYAARHQQFRALSEMTVNKLMSSAHDQLAAMAILKEGQHKLESMTSNTLETVTEGHKTLTQQQERLRSTQQTLQEFVSMNLRSLTREKALIAAGHSELARMTTDMKERLDAAGQQLEAQAAERQDNHRQLVEDLETIQRQAQLIWDRIDVSTTEILAQHAAAAAQYEETLVKLSRINDTVNFLLKLVDRTRVELDIRLAWITSFMGGTGDKLERLYSCLLHGLYLVLGMVAASFLQAPRLTRACLLLIVVLNLTVSFNQGPDAALDFSAMTTIIVASTVVNWFLHLLLAALPGSSSQSRPIAYQLSGAEPTPQAAPPRQTESAWSRLKLSVQHSIVRLNWTLRAAWEGLRGNSVEACPEPITAPSPAHSVRSWVTSHSYHGNSTRRPMGDESSDSDVNSANAGPAFAAALRKRAGGGGYQFQSPPTPSSTPSRTPSRSGTPASVLGTPRRLCSATCRSGQQCKNSASNGDAVCKRHMMETM